MVHYLIIINLSKPCFHGDLKVLLLKIETKVKVVLDMMLCSTLEIYQRLGVAWGLQGGGIIAPPLLFLPKNFFGY
jgi:hypothetical protein